MGFKCHPELKDWRKKVVDSYEPEKDNGNCDGCGQRQPHESGH